jgi:hypothetical protein
MSVWRRTRDEVAGAWRSLRYDLGRRDPRSPDRRVVTVSAFGVLAVAGAAGGYFAVLHGLEMLVTEKPAAVQAHPYPLAAELPTPASTAGLGRGSADRPRRPNLPPPVADDGGPVARRAPAESPAAATPGSVAPRPEIGGGESEEPDGPECDCVTPPVPTPTAPASPSPSPSASPSPSPSLSSSPSARPSGWAGYRPSASPVPSESSRGGAFHHRRHARDH